MGGNVGLKARPEGSNTSTAQARSADQRREHVARMILEGLTVRETAVALSQLDPPIVDPKTLKPFTATTIQRDINKLRAGWREHALQDTIEYKAHQLAELSHAKRKAWEADDLSSIVRLLRLEADITGTIVQAGDPGPNWREICARLGIDPDRMLEFAKQQAVEAEMTRRQIGTPSSAQVVENVNPA